MEITDVKLNIVPEVKEGEMQDGLPVATHPEIISFIATLEDGTEITVPNSPANRHYDEVKSWHAAQKKPPFKFEFAKA